MKKNLPDYIRDDEKLRQTLKAQEGFMKYVAEYIMNGGEDGLSLYSQYQEHIYADYRKTNTWNGDAQLMSDDEFRLEALGPSNHLEKEFRCRMVFEHSISDLPEDAAEAARDYYDAYLAYAWRGFFERRNPDHATDVGFYKIFMEQFQHPDGLVYRSMELVLKDHHGEAWTNDDCYDFYRIAEYYYFYFDIKRRAGRIAFDRLRRGVKEWLEGKDDKECRELAVDMLEKVRLFSQTIYNEGYVQYLRDVKYPAEDKGHFALTGKHLNLDCFLEGAEERERKGKWLREQINKAHLFKSDSILFYFTEFVFILKDIAHIWAARLLKEHNIDLHKLEEECRSFLLPYSPGKDGFDFSYYVDHYYIGDSPNTCCVKGRQKAKELLYALYEIKEGGDLTMITDIAELPKQEEREIKEPINERRGGNGKAPRVVGRPKKTFQEFLKADAPKGLLDVLHEMLKGKSGGDAFPIILAITNVYTDGEPTPKSVINEFGVGETSYRKAKYKHEGNGNHQLDKNGKMEYIKKEPQPVPEESLKKISEEIKNKLSDKAKKSQK